MKHDAEGCRKAWLAWTQDDKIANMLAESMRKSGVTVAAAEQTMTSSEEAFMVTVCEAFRAGWNAAHHAKRKRRGRGPSGGGCGGGTLSYPIRD